MILTISIIIGCCLANTGMLADKGDAAFGIWANVSRQVSTEYRAPLPMPEDESDSDSE